MTRCVAQENAPPARIIIDRNEIVQVTANLTRIAEVLQVGVEYLMYGDDKRAPAEARQGDELALLRLYRECSAEDRQLLLRTARRLVAGLRREADVAAS